MPQLTRIHEVVRQSERDQWYLVHDPCGRRYVLFETLAVDNSSNLSEQGRTRKIPVQAILAQNNELSQKLRSILEL